MAKLTDVAQKLNISSATVSNAFTGKGRMTAETRALILRTAAEVGYEWVPRKTQSGHRNFIVIAEETTLPFTSRMLKGIYQEAEKENLVIPVFGLDAYVKTDNFPPMAMLEREIDRIILAYDKPISGVIYLSHYTRLLEGLLKKYCFPSVGVFCTREDGKPVIYYDDFQGAYLATETLIKLGRTHIAMIGGLVDSYAVFHRTSGYQKALLDHELPYNPDLVYMRSWSPESGYLMAKELLNSGQTVDAIFAQNDLIATGIFRAMREKGLHCPKDISIVGFDNAAFSIFTHPTITTIDTPFEEMGRQAVRSILRAANGEKIESVYLPCSLIIRESTGGI